ncbi:MAG: hypothetical protein FJW39_04935 [Acidobacteria bacterium]|nr:hypothetical protein [Acidobacteriota bacterium]
MRIALILSLVCGISAETKPEIRGMVRKSLDGLNREDQRKSDYLYDFSGARREFGSNGKLVKESSWTSVREIVDGIVIMRGTSEDGKPLTPERLAKQQESIRQYIAAQKAKTPEQKQTERQAARKKEKDEEAWIQEFPEALDYKVAGEEVINSRPALVLDFEPRPGYRAKNMRARIFEKMRGRIWIDKAESEMVKTEAEMFDTVSIGFGVIGKIEKGTQMRFGRIRTGEGHWLIEDQWFKFNARFMMVKTLHREMMSRYTNFRPRPDLARSARF